MPLKAVRKLCQGGFAQRFEWAEGARYLGEEHFGYKEQQKAIVGILDFNGE
jgi:hypothetical protein